MFDFLIQAGTMVLLWIGLWLSGNKRLLGPFLAAVAEGLGLIVGATHHVWSLIGICAVLFFVQSRNFFKWKREGVAW